MVKNPFRKTDANPEVKSANALDTTEAQERKELEGHSDFERKTGVNPDERDTRVVVDTGTPDGSFTERTSQAGQQPWAEYQKGAEKQADEEAAAGRKENERRTKEDKES